MLLRTTTSTAAAIVAAFLLAPLAGGGNVAKPAITWLKGEGNYTKSHRAPESIDRIVVHVTEGAFWGSVQWLQNPRAHASSHYIVARNGKIVQLVHTSDIAWHAGNWKTNLRSVGIEHEGFTYGPNGFTDAQYESSARLAAWIARRALMPIDREHFIGHAEVLSARGGRGGSSHHTDPGPHWSWARYLALVRQYAGTGSRLSVETRLRDGSLDGVVPWRAEVAGGVRTVEFVVDGEVRTTDRRAPFFHGLNTVSLGNGRHVLELRAYGEGTRHDITRRTVTVANRAFSLTTAGARPWTKVRGTVELRSRVWNAKAARVVFKLDGRVRSVDRQAPYVFSARTEGLRDGRHVLEVLATAVDGRVTGRRIPVVVSNRAAQPRPKAKPTPRPVPAPLAPAIVRQSVEEGQELSGLVLWKVETTGKPVRVEFLVDGVVRGTDVAAPFTFGWNTAGEPAGRHVLTARAVAKSGRPASATIRVTVTADPASAGTAAP